VDSFSKDAEGKSSKKATESKEIDKSNKNNIDSILLD